MRQLQVHPEQSQRRIAASCYGFIWLNYLFKKLNIPLLIAVLALSFSIALSGVFSYTRAGAPTRVEAATSSNLNFQARLYNSSGSTVPDGFYNLEFKLYSVSSGGTAEWTETYTGANKVRVVNGYMSVYLGSQTAFPGSINWDQDHWITMNVGGSGSPAWDGEMTPRLKLTAVPYAFQSKFAETLNKIDGSYTGTLDFLTLTDDRTLYLPDEDGTLCVEGSPDCVDILTTGDTATTSSNSGLEVSSDGLRLLGGCSDGQFLTWDETAKVWQCSSGSGSSVAVRESDGSPSVTASTIEFGPATNSDTEFIVTNEGGGVSRIRIGTSILTTSNYSTTLDGIYVNESQSPAAGDITGSFSAGLTIGADAVALGTDTTGDYVANLGTLNGLSTSGNSGEGSTPTLSVLYGSTANTAVQGNVTLVCPSGTGDLSGGGNTITLGTGGTCTSITISEAPVFDTSVTTPLLTYGGALSVQTTATGGADDLIFRTAGTEVMRVLEGGDLFFEKGTNDVTVTFATPGSPATYTFSGASGTILTTANYTGTLDSIYVNVGESPAAGDVSGSFSGGLSVSDVQNNAVDLGAETVGDYVQNLGTLIGLSTSGNSGEGSTPGLSVLYGSSANTAVQGNTTLTCASGTGDLSGGGNTITLGAGGSCNSITISEAPAFDTSVTTPLVTYGGALTVQTTATGGADDLIFRTAGTEVLRLLENGNIYLEKGTNDVTIAVNTPGAPATYTFDGASGTVLTTANYATNLDATYVNVGESPAAGDVSGSFSAGLNVNSVQNNSVDLTTDTVGNYVATITAGNGLTGDATGEGSTPTLAVGAGNGISVAADSISVLYGSTANTAVQGNVTLVCPSGTGDLSGGGNTITLGTGGTCTSITISEAPVFDTSVTTPLLTSTGVLQITNAGAGNDITVTSVDQIILAGVSVDLGSATTGLRVAADGSLLDIDGLLVLNDTLALGSSTTGLQITTDGVITDLDDATITFGEGITVNSGGISVTGNSTISGTLTGLTGLTVSSGGASITGGLNNNSGGITNAGAISGATTIAASTSVTAPTINATTTFQHNGTNGRTLNCAANEGIDDVEIRGGILITSNCRGFGLSDQNLKENISSLSSTVLDDIRDVNVVNFDFDCANSIFSQNGGNYGCDNSTQTGVIAQELESIFPGLVFTGADGYKRVNYEGLSMYTLKAVQELASIIDSTGNASFNSVSIDGTEILTSTGAIQNATGLNVVSGGASIIGNSSVDGTLSLTGAISDADGDLIFDDQVAIGSAATGLQITTDGVITDLDDASVAFGEGIAVTGNSTVTGTFGTYGSGYNFFAAGTNLNSYGYFRSVDTSDSASRFELGAYDINGASQGGRDLVLNPLGGNVGVGGDLTPDALFTVGTTSQFQVSSSGAVTAVGINSGTGQIQGTGGLSVAGTISLNGNISDPDSNLVLDDTVDIGSATTGLRVATDGSILDIDGNLVLNDQVALGSATTGLLITSAGNITDIDGASIVFGENVTVSAGGISVTGNSTIAGTLSSLTGYSQASGNFGISGTGTFSTGTGAVSLNGATSVSGSNTFSVGTGATTLGGSLTTTGLATFNGNLTLQTGDTLTVNGDGLTDLTGNGLTLSGTSLTIDATTAGTVAGTSSNSGLIVSADGLSLLRGCSNGQILKWNGGSTVWNCAADNTGISDQNVKTNVANRGSVLDAIKDVRVVDYNFKCTDPAYLSWNFDCLNHTGIIAQELEAIFPNLVYTGPNGLKNVDFGALNFYTLQAVVELANFIDASGDASLNSVSTGGSLRLTSGGALQNITGLSVVSGGASITGGLNNNSGGITNTGAITGATTINASGLITGAGLAAGSGSITGSGGLTISGAISLDGSISDPTGNLVLNDQLSLGSATTGLQITTDGVITDLDDATITFGEGITVSSGGASITGGLNNNSGGITNTGALSGVTTISASGNINTTGVYQRNGASGVTVGPCGNTQYLGGMQVSGGIIVGYDQCRGVGLSDQRLKENVVSLDGSILDRIKDVNTVTFDFKCDDPAFQTMNEACDPEHQTGVIAQELAQVFPELVYQDEWGFYRVKYDALQIYNLRAVSELAKHVSSSGAGNLTSLTVDGVIEAGTIRADHIEGLDYLGRIDDIEDQLATLEDRVEAIENNQQQNIDLNNLTVGKLTVTGESRFKEGSTFEKDVNIAGKVSIGDEAEMEKLTVNLDLVARGAMVVHGVASFKDTAWFEKDIFVTGNLDVDGNTDLQGLTVNLDLITKGALVVEGKATFKEAVRFEKDVEIGGNLSLKGQAKVGKDTAGIATIEPGQTVVKVEFNEEQSEIPVISLTLGEGKFAQYSYRNVTKDGFEIVISEPTDEPLSFTWLALQRYQTDD